MLRRIRNEGALSFLGPGGFATPDDVEMLELCQKRVRELATWNGTTSPRVSGRTRTRCATMNEHYDNELQMRAYWLRLGRAHERAGAPCVSAGAAAAGSRWRTFSTAKRRSRRLEAQGVARPSSRRVRAMRSRRPASRGCRHACPRRNRCSWSRTTASGSSSASFGSANRRRMRSIRIRGVRHLYSNVRIIEAQRRQHGGELQLRHVPHQAQVSRRRTWAGTAGSCVRDGDNFLIELKRTILDLDGLVPQGKVSLLL